MGKRKRRQVHFNDQTEQVNSTPRNEKDGIDGYDNFTAKIQNDNNIETSLIHDQSNDTNIIPFTLDEDLNDEVDGNDNTKQNRTNSSHHKHGIQDEDYVKADPDEEDEDIESDDEMERIMNVKHKKNSEDDEQNEEEDDDDDNGDVEGKDKLPLNEVDSITLLLKYLLYNETPAQALRRLSSQPEKNEIISACQNCKNTIITGVQRDSILYRIQKWHLYWGQIVNQYTNDIHGPFQTQDFKRWAKARYFIQKNKIGWIRPVGGHQWVKASDIFKYQQ